MFSFVDTTLAGDAHDTVEMRREGKHLHTYTDRDSARSIFDTYLDLGIDAEWIDRRDETKAESDRINKADAMSNTAQRIHELVGDFTACEQEGDEHAADAAQAELFDLLEERFGYVPDFDDYYLKATRDETVQHAAAVGLKLDAMGKDVNMIALLAMRFVDAHRAHADARHDRIRGGKRPSETVQPLRDARAFEARAMHALELLVDEANERIKEA